MNIAERTLLDTVRIVETREVGHESYEICATARATYDEAAGKMRIVLDAFVRHFEMRGRDEILHPPWLPRSDAVETHVSLEEAPEAAKEIFDSWAHKLCKTIPGGSEWRPEVSWLRDESEPVKQGSALGCA